VISALERGIELRSAAGTAAATGVVGEVGVGEVIDDVTSAFSAIFSAPVCKMHLSKLIQSVIAVQKNVYIWYCRLPIQYMKQVSMNIRCSDERR